MQPDRVADALVLGHTRRVLDSDATLVARVPIGFGNLNWRVRCRDGDFIVKIGRPESAAKWASGNMGRVQAQAAGVEGAYETVHRERPDWSDRLRLVALVETLSIVANAHQHHVPHFTSEATVRLTGLLRRPR